MEEVTEEQAALLSVPYDDQSAKVEKADPVPTQQAQPEVRNFVTYTDHIIRLPDPRRRFLVE